MQYMFGPFLSSMIELYTQESYRKNTGFGALFLNIATFTATY